MRGPLYLRSNNMAIREMEFAQNYFGYWDKRDCINMLKHNADIDEHDDWHEIRAILTDEGQIVFYDREGKLRIVGGLYDEQKEKSYNKMHVLSYSN